MAIVSFPYSEPLIELRRSLRYGRWMPAERAWNMSGADAVIFADKAHEMLRRLGERAVIVIDGRRECVGLGERAAYRDVVDQTAVNERRLLGDSLVAVLEQRGRDQVVTIEGRAGWVSRDDMKVLRALSGLVQKLRWHEDEGDVPVWTATGVATWNNLLSAFNAASVRSMAI